MDKINNQKPCLLNTPQGFSVSYRQKILYSKYNPAGTILKTIENLQILPGTLFLCCSPVLPYGLKELNQKLKENCMILVCEAEKELLEFEKSEYLKTSGLGYLNLNEIYNLPVILNKKKYILECGVEFPPAGTFKRVIKIDFSAGSSFNDALYKELYSACTNAIMTWWSNRITLTKFGRKYSENFFKNLKVLNKTVPIQNYFEKISKPIVVCGAGESLDFSIPELKKNAKKFCILCADTALQPLLANKIIPDGVFVEETQQVITKAFIGTNKNEYDFHIFAGLSAVSSLARIFALNKISFFTTLYSDCDFLQNCLKNKIIPPSIPPFGSVGLTAVYFALKFRKNSSVPVYVIGLDFSYSAGKTHAKGTLAHKTRMLANTKLNPIQNYGSCFNIHSTKFADKSENIFYTMPVMKKYSELFNSFFCNTENLFDAGICGIPLKIERKFPEPCNFVAENNCGNGKENSDFIFYDTEKWILQEKNALLYLKSLLTEKTEFTEEKLKEEIIKTAENREYLYLHFPDGWKFQYNQSFLNRIRAQIDFFLKILN